MEHSRATQILRIFIWVAAMAVTMGSAWGQTPITLYQASDSSNNLVPDGPDGTPNRPNGEMMGNTVVLGTGNGVLTGATIKVGTTDTSETQDITLSLYLNDGPMDPGGSGMQQPGTLIDSLTDSGVSLAGGVVPVSFNFPSLSVPQSFTFIISFSPGSDAGSFVGVMSDNSGPEVGSGMNTLWYGTGTPGDWTTDTDWAIADGAQVNYFDATFVEAIPEPAKESTLGIGSLGAWLVLRRRRIRARKARLPVHK